MTPILKKMKFDSYLTSYIKINSISVIDINVKNQMIKLLENNIGEYSHDLGVSEEILYRKQKAQTKKKKINRFQMLSRM